MKTAFPPDLLSYEVDLEFFGLCTLDSVLFHILSGAMSIALIQQTCSFTGALTSQSMTAIDGNYASSEKP